jgi:hypothetical protein
MTATWPDAWSRIACAADLCAAALAGRQIRRLLKPRRRAADEIRLESKPRGARTRDRDRDRDRD